MAGTGPCEKAATELVNALFKEMPKDMPIREFMEAKLNEKLVGQFKSMKENFLVEVIPKINDIKDEMKAIIDKKGADNVNYGVAMLMYYAASSNVGKEDINKFLVEYGKTGKGLLAQYLAQPLNAKLVEDKKVSATEVALTFESAVDENAFRAFSTELYRYSTKAAGEKPSEVLFRTGTE